MHHCVGVVSLGVGVDVNGCGTGRPKPPHNSQALHKVEEGGELQGSRDLKAS